jgi:hypothetical protein
MNFGDAYWGGTLLRNVYSSAELLNFIFLPLPS